MDISIDYIAGIIDGEGSIICIKSKVRVQIANTDMNMLYKIQRSLGFGSVSQYKERKPNWKKAGIYRTCNNNESRKLLELLNGKLIIKQDKCEKAINILCEYYKKLEKYNYDKEKALEMLKTQSVRQVAKEIGYSHGAVGRWRKDSKLFD
jgi:hypothetical protein